AAGVQLEETSAASGSELHTGVDDYLVAGVIMNLPPCLDELALTELDVLVVGDGQVIIGPDLGLAVGVGGVMLFGQVLGVAVGFDAFVAFVADADGLVVLNVLVPVALGVDEDLFFAGPVFDAQFVEAVAAGAAQALEDGSGLVLGQLVGHRVGAVVQTAGDQGLVGVAFEEADQNLHADARDGDAAPVVAGPAAGHPQPAAGVGVGLALAVPVELDLDPAPFVTVDFFAGGAGDHGGLLAQHPGLGMAQGWAVRGVPGGGLEVVAVALGEAWIPLSPAHCSPLRGSPFGPAFGCSALRLSRKGRGKRSVYAWHIRVGNRFLKNLRLLAFVVDGGDQPEVVPAVSRVALQFEEVAAAQGRLVAVAGSLAVVAAVAFEAALGQVLAAAAVGEAAGVVVVFQVGQLFSAGLTFQQQAGLLVVVVAAGDAAGAGFQADAEALDHRLIGDHAVALIKAGGRQAREHRLVVAEHQVMAVRAVAE